MARHLSRKYVLGGGKPLQAAHHLFAGLKHDHIGALNPALVKQLLLHRSVRNSAKGNGARW